MSQITIIGDITIDYFINLPSSYIHKVCRLDDQNCELVLPYGTKIPVDDVQVKAGGNGANVAVGLKRLGVSITPIIPLGHDPISTIALGYLGKEKIELHSNLINEHNRCNSAFVFKFEQDRTIFSHHEPKLYPLPDEIDSRYTYFSTHGGDNTSLSTQLLALIQESKSKLIFALSNTHLKGDKIILEALISHSHLFICNKAEALETLSRIDDTEINIEYILHRIHHFGANHVVITDGKNGVYFLDGDTETTGHQDSVLDQSKVVEVTGAGDAMCTGIMYGLMNGNNLEQSIYLGLQESASVLQQIGAQTGLLLKSELGMA